MRFHYILNIRQKNEPTAHGKKIATFQAPNGVFTRTAREVSYEIMQVNVEESFCQTVAEDTAHTELVSKIGSRLDVSQIGGISHELRTSAHASIRHSLQKSNKLSQSQSERKVFSRNLSHEINEHTTEAIVLVEAFQKYEIDVVLGYIDYLTVEYKASIFGLRRKRQKYPSIQACGTKTNIVKFNEPICCLEAWLPQAESSIMLLEREYSQQVVDPTEISILAPKESVSTRGFPKGLPSLYQLANAAFPLKWSKRQTEWSEEELRSIEEEDKKTSWPFLPNRN